MANARPELVHKLIDYYKEETGSKAKTKPKTTSPRKRSARRTEKGVDMDDEEAGWELGGKKFDGWS